MNTVYFISGLGADERLFQFIRLEGVRIQQVKWITPLRKETWEAYAERLLSQIPDKNPVIVGMSMGGMMAVEISKIMKTEKIVLISSAKNYHEIPPYFCWLRWTGIHRWLPYPFFKFSGQLLGHWLFGTQTQSERELLSQIIRDTDETFFRWAWEKVITWKNEYIPPGVFHLHGERDHLLPIRYIGQPDQVLKSGTHFMIVHEAVFISRILQQIIDQL